ncbi:IMPACT family protein [Halegenticoccus tardaugens]|uniref:IMPACT family protein n=1 Tax=Halegenticoccus tardaugens TaxID=2071624 RepID=UPI00100BDB6C|nr:YigZ family protein [Halegenticoccus tardaugens]
MTDPYRTVAGRGEARFEVRGSEFIGHVAPADTVEGAEAFAEEIEARHPDATHNVPAYRVPAGEASSSRPGGSAMLREWSSDDGEPSGSSGKPALNVLVQRDLRNVAAVVTRYYGGTNLGVGGLARAYSRGVKEAVDAAGVAREVPHERLSVVAEYDDSGTVRGIIESAGVEFEADYGADARFSLRVPVDEAEALRDRLRSATSGRVGIE